MADALVSTVLGKLTSILRQQIEEKVQLVVGVEDEVQKLACNFQTIQAVLKDAERRELMDEGAAVRVWLDDLKDACYDIDDLLDEWSTAILKHQIERVDDNASALEKVCSFFSSLCHCFGQVSLRDRHDIAISIKKLNDRFDAIAKKRETFRFEVNNSNENEPKRLKSTSLFDVSEVKGRASDKNDIIDRLLCENSQEEKVFHIISIVGLGGIGKTTLAQLAYNDNDVENHFEKKLWVCVSDPFDEVKIAKAILQELHGASPTPTTNELNALHKQIHDLVKKKKFLLVLDDVWTEDNSKWERLKFCLMSGSNGSKVLVTTRNERVAKLMSSTYIHHLQKLSELDCWSLFRQIAFLERSGEECENLEEIGKKLVEKCDGLPLAAKTLGSLMRLKDSKEEWRLVLDSEVWKLEVIERRLSAPLLLSYYDLPYKMKRLFSYCAVFPKDEWIERDFLVQLWMAQGYLDSEKNEMEIKGREYFKELAMRSFFQDFEMDEVDGSIIGCRMHDIVHDFAQVLTQNECIVMENDNANEPGKESSSIRTRHASITHDLSSSLSFPNTKNLRTLLFHSSPVDLDVTELWNRLSCLRALDISRCDIREIPWEVRKLIHLRYLNLSLNEDLNELPEEVCELCNLQTLILDWCYSFVRLPQGIGRLIKLRHLQFDGTRLEGLPKGIGRLSCLRTLTKFIVSDDCKIGELRSLNHLQGNLIIEGLRMVTNANEVERAELKNKKELRELTLCFNDGAWDYVVLLPSWLESVEILDFEVLPLPSQLEKLYLLGHGNNTLSTNWSTFSSNLKTLHLECFLNCECLLQLGCLASLESLAIRHMDGVKRVGVEFLGIEIAKKHEPSFISFPKLKELKFEFMVE